MTGVELGSATSQAWLTGAVLEELYLVVVLLPLRGRERRSGKERGVAIDKCEARWWL